MAYAYAHARRRPRGAPLIRPETLGGYAVCALLLAAGLLLREWRPAEDVGPAVGPSAPTTAEHFTAIRAVDGDTLVLNGERVRIDNIDAPEMPPKSRCASERDGALRAAAELRTLIRSGELTLERTGTDRYGRTLGRVYVDGRDVGRTLVAARLVRPWEGRRRSWCA